MKVNFSSLYNVQHSVDKRVYTRLKESGIEKPDPIYILLAMQVEFFEFINEVGAWKWWKQNQSIDRSRVLDELADIMAFFLSLQNSRDDSVYNELDKGLNELINDYQQYDLKTVLQFVSISIESDDSSLGYAKMMASAISLAKFHLEDLTWEEVEEAYIKKSEENIKRQERDY